MITINNIVKELNSGFGVKKQRLYKPSDKWRKYKLLEAITIQLTNGDRIIIPRGFEWDLSSVPKILWFALSPDGNFEIAALIHDFLYRYQLISRKFADQEMLRWSMELNSTKTELSLRHTDNYARYYGVRLFGSFAWKN